MKSKPHHLLPWLPALLWMVAIFYFASHPTPLPHANGNAVPPVSADATTQQAVKLNIPWDKLAHMGEYAGLYFWLYFGFSSRENPSFAGNPHKSWKTLGMIFVISSLYALSDEIHQIFVIGRGFEYADLGVDMIGMTITMGLIIIYKTVLGA